MLNLSRKNNEVICIGDNIQIKVLGMKGGQIPLGIDAPSHISVHREEIYHKIQQKKVGNADLANSFDVSVYGNA